MNKRKQRMLGIFALVIALIATTVAYAALSTTLNISGSVTKKGGAWGEQIVDESDFTTSGSATTTSTKPTLTGNTSLSFSANLYKPGDTFSFTFKIRNTGSIDAKIDTSLDWWQIFYARSSFDSTGSEYGNLINPWSGESPYDISCQMLYNGIVLNQSWSNLSNLNVTAGATTDAITLTCKYNDVTEISAEDETRSFSIHLPYIQA